jgi:hypothetical protein
MLKKKKSKSLLFCFFEPGTHYIAQAGPLQIILPLPPEDCLQVHHRTCYGGFCLVVSARADYFVKVLSQLKSYENTCPFNYFSCSKQDSLHFYK